MDKLKKQIQLAIDAEDVSDLIILFQSTIAYLLTEDFLKDFKLNVIQRAANDEFSKQIWASGLPAIIDKLVLNWAGVRLNENSPQVAEIHLPKPTSGKPLKFFISYKFTGVPMEELHDLIDDIRNIIDDTTGCEVFCNLYEDDIYVKEEWSGKMVMARALQQLDESDVMICINNGEFGSGMGIEFGYAVSKGKKILYCEKIGEEGTGCVSARALATVVYEYDTTKDLVNLINGFTMGVKCMQ